jgi:hypothetical protein
MANLGLANMKQMDSTTITLTFFSMVPKITGNSASVII